MKGARRSTGAPCGEVQMTATALGAKDAAARLKAVQAAVAAACAKARRDAAEVTLVAVSKTFDAEAVAPVLAAGQRVFGENRVQEAMAKWPALRAQYPAS